MCKRTLPHNNNNNNEIRDLTATLLTEVCSEVSIEPELQPVMPQQLTGATANAQDGARLDISAIKQEHDTRPATGNTKERRNGYMSNAYGK